VGFIVQGYGLRYRGFRHMNTMQPPHGHISMPQVHSRFGVLTYDFVGFRFIRE